MKESEKVELALRKIAMQGHGITHTTVLLTAVADEIAKLNREEEPEAQNKSAEGQNNA